jgi:hypothetical protein
MDATRRLGCSAGGFEAVIFKRFCSLDGINTAQSATEFIVKEDHE